MPVYFQSSVNMIDFRVKGSYLPSLVKKFVKFSSVVSWEKRFIALDDDHGPD